MVKRRRRRSALKVTGDGNGVANHAGARLLVDLADAVGLTGGLSVAMAPSKQRRRGHDRGGVLADLAVAIADGAETISDLAVLRDQPALFGPVASHPTVWRTLAAVDDAALERIKQARAEARRRAWASGVDPGFYVIDIDATHLSARIRTRNRRRRRGSAGSGSIRCSPTLTPRVKHWPGCCDRATPVPGPLAITSVCSPMRSPSCRSIRSSVR